tara:strand:+ start:2678 stop:5059 length:2382 start_codon:yes stop_codon:yes gene_type:complete
MANFIDTQDQFSQEHFEVVEIDLPIIAGTCTIDGNPGFGTPLSCDQSYPLTPGENDIQTYRFTMPSAPLIPVSGIMRYVKSISERTAELKPGNGLAARGTGSISFIDFEGDPNPDAPGVTDDVLNSGTFFGKLNARQVFVNKPVRIKLYRVEADGSIDIVNGSQTRHYIAESFKSNGNGSWSLNLKDELSVANIGEKVWPSQETLGYLKFDVNSTATHIFVDPNVDYSGVTVVRINDEFMGVSVQGSTNQTPDARLNIDAPRGQSIVGPISGEVLTQTIVQEHKAGDEVFVCKVSDNEKIYDLLERILLESDVDQSLITIQDWQDEIDLWHAGASINTLWYESQDVSKVINKILNDYLLDMWFDPEDRKIKISAISVWKQSEKIIREGNEINYRSLKVTPMDSMRTTRALAIYDKTFLAESDDVANYAKASQYTETSLALPQIYGEHKDKVFPSSTLLRKTSADLLVQRTVKRFGLMPEMYSWTTPERKLNINVGDVVGIETSSIQSFSGQVASLRRAQILSINPKYKSTGREYAVKALSYEAAGDSTTRVVLQGDQTLYDIHINGAGGPVEPVDITIVFDGATSSSSLGSYAITVGDLPAGSKVILILVGQADLQASGGKGGDHEKNGVGGAMVLNTKDIDFDIYLDGVTPDSTYSAADGYLRAPGGGGGGGEDYEVSDQHFNGGGGGGGAGRQPGAGGLSTSALPLDIHGEDGFDGDVLGNGGAGGEGYSGATDGGDGGDWGQPGIASNGNAGLAGIAIRSTGGTVNVYGGNNALRYIAGNSDTVNLLAPL